MHSIEMGASTSTASKNDAAAASASAADSKKSTSTSVTIQSFKADPSAFVTRYKHALIIQQQHRAGRVLNKKDRGNLMGTLQLLYFAEEVAARKKLSESKSKPSSSSNTPSTSSTHSSASSTSLNPLQLPSECNVCYSAFTLARNTPSENETCALRVRMHLCGHSSICADCFSQYLSSRITSDDLMPFIPCPEEGCKLPLSHLDLQHAFPTIEQSIQIETEYNHAQEIIAKRNQKAFDALHASALDMDRNSQKNHQKGKLKKTKSKAAKAAAPSSTTASSSSSSTASEGEDEAVSSSSSSSSSSSPASCASVTPASSLPAINAPVAPPLLVETATYFIPTPLLLQLVTLHMSKILLRCDEWLPCGTFPLAAKKGKDADADADADASAESVEESKSDDSEKEKAAPTCVGGFLLLPPLYTRYSAKPKVRKCEHCGLLQHLKPKNSQSTDAVGQDAELKKLVDEGILRPCPSCNCLNGKDHGMCNVIQCVQCQIYWNWRTRATGDNPARMKEQARNDGSLWEAGELNYQLNLQHSDPEAFKALLRKNGIEFNPNYIRGSSK